MINNNISNWNKSNNNNSIEYMFRNIQETKQLRILYKYTVLSIFTETVVK